MKLTQAERRLGKKYREIRSDPNANDKPSYKPLQIENNGIGCIVIVGNDSSTEVKIGYSYKSTPHERYQQYVDEDVFGNSSVIFLASVRATKTEEDAIHNYFMEKGYWNDGRSGRSKTEFFYPRNSKGEEEIIDYIAFLRSLYFVSVTLEGSETEQGMQCYPYGIWEPNDGHRKPERAEEHLFSGPWAFLPERTLVFNRDEWFTDPIIVNATRKAMGGRITLDPASHVVPQSQIVKADHYYNEHENGLIRPWFGNVFLNPPFTKWKVFAAKILRELPNIERMVVLANSRTVTAAYFKEVYKKATATCTLHKRYSFWGRDKKGSPTNGQVMLYFSNIPGDDGSEFNKAFSAIGTTARVIHVSEACDAE